MASQQPGPGNTPNKIASVAAYSRRFLLYGFLISIALHLIFGPLVDFKRIEQDKEKVETVSVTKKPTRVVTPKPTPTPPPQPTPTPHNQTPPPNTPPPKQVRLKVDVPKTTANSKGGQTETQYNVTKGSQEGVPQGQDKGATAAAAAAPPPSPSPTPPRPACQNPNVDATATDKVSPEMPEIARQMGATGTAQIRVSLDENGKILSTAIYKSTNNKALDNAALDAAKQSKYAPEIKNCTKTAGSYLYVVVFEAQ